MKRMFSTLLACGALALSGLVAATPAEASSGSTTYRDTSLTGEQTVTIEGTLESAVTDTFGSQPASHTTYALRTAAGTLVPVEAEFGKDVPARSRVKARVVDDGSRVKAVQSATIAAPAVALAAAAPSAHKVYVAVVTNRGSVEETNQEVEDIVDSITGYWKTESDGVISSFARQGSIVRYASSVASSVGTSCSMRDPWALWNEAASQPQFAGVNFNAAGTHLFVMESNECGSAGPAGVGSVGISGFAAGGQALISMGTITKQVATHEVGHNFGLQHANAEACSTISTCPVSEYFDLFSPMALAVNSSTVFTPPALDTTFRELLDLTDTTEMPTVSTAGPHALRLVPRASGTGRRALKVVDPLTGRSYYVEYRSGTGRDTGTFYSGSGILVGIAFRYRPGITVSRRESNGATTLLTRKSGSTYPGSLLGSETYVNPSRSIRITSAPTQDATGVDVTVTLSHPTTPPSATPTFGTARVGLRVAANTAGWIPGTGFTYQWNRSGRPISGARYARYVPVAADRGRSLTVTVTGTSPGFVTAVSKRSAARKVGYGKLVARTPKITGKVKVGKKLKAHRGTWSPTPRYSYRWYANGKRIKGATKSRYKITKSRKGKRITVKVTGKRTGYASITKTSKRTGKVKK